MHAASRRLFDLTPLQFVTPGRWPTEMRPPAHAGRPQLDEPPSVVRPTAEIAPSDAARRCRREGDAIFLRSTIRRDRCVVEQLIELTHHNPALGVPERGVVAGTAVDDHGPAVARQLR